MAGQVRVTTGRYSREVGTSPGITVNVFGLKALEGITGQELAVILMEAAQPALATAQEDWPKQTWASHDSLRLEEVEVAEVRARVHLTAGGQQLISDPRNKKHIDYAPFIEFNGTQTAQPGVILHSVLSNEREMKEAIKTAIAELIRSKLA